MSHGAAPNGVQREHAAGFVAAAYQHRTSRAQDPHLHTHVIVANMAQTPSDGKWRALDGEPILKSYRLAAGYLYQAQLRAELTRRPRRRMGRAAQGDGRAQARPARGDPRVLDPPHPGRRGARAAGQGRLLRRPARGRRDARAEGARRPRPPSRGLARPCRRARPRRPRTARAARARPPPGALARDPAPARPPDARPAGTDREADRVLRSRSRDGLGAGTPLRRPRRAGAPARVPPHPHRWCRGGRRTSEPGPAGPLLDDRARRRRACSARARRARTRRRSALDHRAAARRDRASRQARALATSRRRWFAKPRRVPTASSASSASPARERRPRPTPSRQVFAEAGIEVLGAAPSGVAAEKLQDETGISATTLHRLLDDARASGGLPSGSVLVVDEAGMAETRVLAPILELVEQANGKAILIGDPHQLPAVGAGGLFAGIVEREGAVVLTENRRQRDELERDALAQRPRRSRPRLPRLRREARATRRLRKPGHHPSATARRLVGAGP